MMMMMIIILILLLAFSTREHRIGCSLRLLARRSPRAVEQACRKSREPGASQRPTALELDHWPALRAAIPQQDGRVGQHPTALVGVPLQSAARARRDRAHVLQRRLVVPSGRPERKQGALVRRARRGAVGGRRRVRLGAEAHHAGRRAVALVRGVVVDC